MLNALEPSGPTCGPRCSNNIISIASILFYLHVYGRYTAGQTPDIWGDGWGTFISSRTMLLGR